MYWVDRKKGEYLFRLPGEAIGRVIQVSFSAAYGIAMEQVQFGFSWNPRRQHYARGETRR